MLRSFAIALGAVAVLAAAHPAEAARQGEARSKATRAAEPARAAARPANARPANARAAVAAARRPEAVPRGRAAAQLGRQRAASAATGRPVFSVRAGSRQQALRYADRRSGAVQARPGLRFVGLFSTPAAAASLPARSGKYGKAAYSMSREDADEPRSTGRMGVWHAGLPAADGEQMDCPTGTMAVLARGHSDTFRCMPM